MENRNEPGKPNNNSSYKNKVHKTLAFSYSFYFVFFLAGIFFDTIFRFRIFVNSTAVPTGIIFLILATLLILWAQGTSRNLKKDTINLGTFCKGPYCYTRSPTHWGIFFLMVGFGIIANAPFVVLSTLIAFIVTKFVFLDKQEKILAHKYGAPYLEYKKLVKF